MRGALETIDKEKDPERWAYVRCNAVTMACRAGSLEALELALAHQMPCERWAFDEAVKGGHLHIMDRLVDYDPRLADSRFPFYHAAAAGRIDLLEWGRRYRAVNRNTPSVWHAAAEHGQVAVLQWARERGFLYRDGSLCWCAARGNEERGDCARVFEWLHKGEQATWPCYGKPCAWAREHRAEMIKPE